MLQLGLRLHDSAWMSNLCLSKRVMLGLGFYGKMLRKITGRVRVARWNVRTSKTYPQKKRAKPGLGCRVAWQNVKPS